MNFYVHNNKHTGWHASREVRMSEKNRTRV